MRLSQADLTLLRDSKAHYSDLYLSIYQPNVVLRCRVDDGTIEKGEREITYDSVTFGSWQNVKIGATLLVGSSVGARDVGKVRIKSITSSVITVAENSHIEWANNQFLTVLDYFDIWTIFPRIIQDPNDDEKTIWYKDYDILYTNQNEKLGAFMNIGPHRAAFVENGSAPLYFSASGSYPLSGGSIGGKVWWEFQSGTPSTYHGNEPGYVDWGTPGNYLVTCSMSGTNGWGEIGYRYVRIHDKPGEGDDVPVTKWEISELSGSRGEGGYTASVRVFEEVEVEEGSIIVIFADEWYDGTRKSIGGNAPHAGAIKFVGYVLDNSINYDYANSYVTFEIASITQVMKELEGFAIELQSKSSPSDWYEMDDVDAKKAVYHYLKWHSNVISLADIEFIGEDFLVQYFDSDRESMFDAIDNFLRSAYHASVVSDRQGKLYLETDAWVVPDATGTFTPAFTMDNRDWIGEPSLTERRYPELSYLEYNGIAFAGTSSGTFKPLMGEAPGSAPAYRGGSERHTGFALGSQAQLNQLVGNEFEHRNTQFPSADFQMRGNWSNLDIAPQEAVQLDIDASDTVRNKAINAPYFANSMTWRIDVRNKALLPRVTFTAITSGEPGETIPIPELPDDGGYGPRPGGPGPILIPSIPLFTGTFGNGVYAALKLETNGAVNVPLPQSFIKELPLTVIEFSSDSLPPGTASGSWSGSIVPAIGASGTYPFNYGFVSSQPGIYRVSYTLTIVYSSVGSGEAPIIATINSNSAYAGVVGDVHYQVYDLNWTGIQQSIHDSTILKLPANGYVYITVSNLSTATLILDRGSAFVEFLKYEL